MNRSLLLLSASLLLASAGCERNNAAETKKMDGPPPAMPVSVLEAKPTTLPLKANLPGRLEPFRQAEVRARVSGILLKRTYHEGQDVKEGDLLFEIDPASYEASRDASVAAVQRAEANLANIQDKEESYRPLVSKGAVSERDHTDLILQQKMALAELASARAELKKADLELSYTKVTSPISGRARAELVTEGALVGHGTPTPLTTVEQLDPIYVKFNQPASEIIAIRHGINETGWKALKLDEIPINLILPDGSTYKHPGKLVFSDLAVDPETDTIQMKAVFPNSNFELVPGTYVRVEYDNALRQAVYLIPRVAVNKTAKGTFVMVVGKDNTVEMKPVKADEMFEDKWIVTSGLNQGDKVIVGKHMFAVQPGSKVVIDNAAAPQQKAKQ